MIEGGGCSIKFRPYISYHHLQTSNTLVPACGHGAEI